MVLYDQGTPEGRVLLTLVRDCQRKSEKLTKVKGKQHFHNLGQGEYIIFDHHGSI